MGPAAALLRFPCAFLDVLWLAFSLSTWTAARSGSLLLEKSLVISPLGLLLFILLQLVAETGFSRRASCILFQCAGVPLVLLLWFFFPELPVAHWHHALVFRYASTALLLLGLIGLSPCFFHCSEDSLWKFHRLLGTRVLKTLFLGLLLFTGALILAFALESDEKTALGLSCLVSAAAGGFYFLYGLPRIERLPAEAAKTSRRLYGFILFASAGLFVGIGYFHFHLIRDFIAGNARPVMMHWSLLPVFGAVVLYWIAYPFRRGWLQKMFAVLALLGILLFLSAGFHFYHSGQAGGISFVNSLLWAAVGYLLMLCLLIALRRSWSISWIPKSAVVFLVVISIGPLSVFHVSEFFLAKKLHRTHAAFTEAKEKGLMQQYGYHPLQEKARAALSALDLGHGYSWLPGDPGDDSPRAIWVQRRIQGFDIMPILREIPRHVGRYLIMLYSFDPGRSCRAADKLGVMGEQAVPAVPHLIAMLDRSGPVRFFSAAGSRRAGCVPGHAAEDALIRIGRPAVPYLVNAYRTADKDSVRRDIFAILRAEASGEGRQVLAAMVEAEPNQFLRRRTVGFLGSAECRDANACWAGELLISALRDPSPKVRRGAAESLGRLGYEPGAKPLLRLLAEQEPLVKIAAIRALARLKCLQAMDPLTELAQSNEKRVRAAASRALRKITGLSADLSGCRCWQCLRRCYDADTKPLEPLELREMPDKPAFPYQKRKFERRCAPPEVISFEFVE